MQGMAQPERPISGEHVGHTHGVSSAADRSRLLVAPLLIVGFMVCEVVVGLLAHSLALLSDAGHMLTDAGALGLSLVAMRLAARPPAGGLTFGLKRAEILSGLANGVALFVLAALIVYEAIRRLQSPPEVSAWYMLAVAIAGVAVNLWATWQLALAERKSLNIRGSYQHILTDLYAFVGTALAAVVILATGFNRADAVASLFIAALMFRAGYRLMREATLVLVEAAPAGMRPEQMVPSLTEHPLVVNVHDFHVWEITSGMPALAAHVLVKPGEDCHTVRRDLERTLMERFDVEHTTLQVDHVTEEPGLIQIEPAESWKHPER